MLDNHFFATMITKKQLGFPPGFAGYITPRRNDLQTQINIPGDNGWKDTTLDEGD